MSEQKAGCREQAEQAAYLLTSAATFRTFRRRDPRGFPARLSRVWRNAAAAGAPMSLGAQSLAAMAAAATFASLESPFVSSPASLANAASIASTAAAAVAARLTCG